MAEHTRRRIAALRLTAGIAVAVTMGTVLGPGSDASAATSKSLAPHFLKNSIDGSVIKNGTLTPNKLADAAWDAFLKFDDKRYLKIADANQYLKKAAADSIYMKRTDADSTYLKASDASTFERGNGVVTSGLTTVTGTSAAPQKVATLTDLLVTSYAVTATSGGSAGGGGTSTTSGFGIQVTNTRTDGIPVTVIANGSSTDVKPGGLISWQFSLNTPATVQVIGGTDVTTLTFTGTTSVNAGLELVTQAVSAQALPSAPITISGDSVAR